MLTYSFDGLLEEKFENELSNVSEGSRAMITGVIFFTFAALVFISGLHFYWVFGGRWGGSAAVPSKPGGVAVFVPRTAETLGVAIIIIAVGLLLLAQNDFLSVYPPNHYTKWGCLVCALVFLVRAIGDFRYVGFTKRIRGTVFATNDTRFYSPLCLLFSMVFLLATL